LKRASPKQSTIKGSKPPKPNSKRMNDKDTIDEGGSLRFSGLLRRDRSTLATPEGGRDIAGVLLKNGFIRKVSAKQWEAGRKGE
jgi:hypothetical protein